MPRFARRIPVRALCLLALISPAFGQTVTATARVEVDGKVERVRKINERWWSEDNRQMFPPKDPTGMFGLWIIDKKSAGDVFYHHRPVELARAESLHLMMTPETVRQVMGEPNKALLGPDGRPAFYFYYAAEGTSVTVRFMQNDLLGEAKYDRIGGQPLGGRMVASVDRDLGGRSIYQILQEQANARVAQRAADRGMPSAPAARTTAAPRTTPTVMTTPSVTVAAFDAPQAPARRITAEAWKAVSVGMSRADVIARLGEPLSTMKIAGTDPAVETLQYALEAEDDAKVRLEAGKVVRITP